MFPARFEALRRVTDQLQGLTPEQRGEIERILRDGRERIADFFVLFEPDIQDVFRQMREDIHAQLTPEQRQRMEDLMRQRLRRTEEHPFPAKRAFRGGPTN
jgi:Spy/CpxP family protein refolding chaperone